MFCICVLIIAAAAVYMVEAYIHTYYAIEYMHGAPLFFVLLAKYAAPVLFCSCAGTLYSGTGRNGGNWESLRRKNP